MPIPLPNRLPAEAAASCLPREGCPPLIAYLTQVPDPRDARGVRHPLPAILALLTCALLCGARSLTGVADWGRDHSAAMAFALGFTREKTPCCATLINVLEELDWEALERALRAWVQAAAGAPKDTSREPASEGLALDGKALRGARKRGAEVTSLVSALGHRLGVTFGVLEIKEGDEIAAVRRLLGHLDLTGKVVTLDALHTQRDTAAQIVAGGGDYLMIVKGNQPQLRDAIAARFAPGAAQPSRRVSAEEFDEGHGRIETRYLQAVSVTPKQLDWPGARQVVLLERQTWRDERTLRQEVVYGVTSLRRKAASPACLLRYAREHWHIENRSHWVRDVVYGEDASLAAKGKTPQTLALLRTLAISCLRLAGVTNIARETRRLAAQPWRTLSMLGLAADN